MNSSFSYFDNEVAKCMIFGLFGVPRLISSIISIDNVDFSRCGGMFNLPSLGASERFSTLDMSLIFTYSQYNGTFRFSLVDLFF